MPTRTDQETLAVIRQLGVVRPGDLEARGIPRGRVYRLLRRGLVERKARGLYVASDHDPKAEHSLAQVGKKVPRGVICPLLALQYHEPIAHVVSLVHDQSLIFYILTVLFFQDMVHLFVQEMHRVEVSSRNALLSAGAGASLAYVLMRILPKLAAQEHFVEMFLKKSIPALYAGLGIFLPCQKCDKYCPVYDHMQERQWQHLNTCHVAPYIHARLPRIKYKEHGMKCIISEWAETRSDMTMAFMSHLIAFEQECSVQGVVRLTHVSRDRCWGVMERAVRRGLHRRGNRYQSILVLTRNRLPKGTNMRHWFAI